MVELTIARLVCGYFARRLGAEACVYLNTRHEEEEAQEVRKGGSCCSGKLVR